MGRKLYPNESRYTLKFETIDGSLGEYSWIGPSLYNLKIDDRPHSPVGVKYRDGKKSVCIPWHQVKRSELIEKTYDDELYLEE